MARSARKFNMIMTTQEIEKLTKNLQVNFPLIGHTIRMAAIKKLTIPVTAESIPHVIAALNLIDGKVVEAGRTALLSLKNQGAVDAFCNIWFRTRNKELDEILAETKYVAETPLETKVATALKAGKLSLCDTEASFEFLVKFLSDQDTGINQNAKNALLSLKNQSAIDAFCNAWYITRDKVLDEILTLANYVAKKPLETRVCTALKARKLALCDNKGSVEFLIKFLSAQDSGISQNAKKALFLLKNPGAVDAFCNTWYKTRDKVLDEILAATNYLAEKPLETKVATALKAGKLALCDNEGSVEFLVKFLSYQDAGISQNAKKALFLLKNPGAVDAFCNTWYKTRDKVLDEILAATNYLAEKPLETKVATALKAGKLTLCDNEAAVEFLIKFLSDKDAGISQNAKKALLSLNNQGAVDAFCEGIINGTFTAVQDVAKEANFQPKAIGRRCLFFVITGQVEKYLELDFEFQYLRTEYQAAPDNIQQRVRAAIQQSNDNRLMGLFGEVRKKFVAKELTEHEAELMLDVYTRNRQMEEIFALLFFAPLKVTVKALDVLLKASWSPADDERLRFFNELVKINNEMGENLLLADMPEVALGPVFKKWFNTARKKYRRKSEKELRELVKTDNPPIVIKALTALNEKRLLNKKEKEDLTCHPHWLVRMAFASPEDFMPEMMFSKKKVEVNGGGDYWLANSQKIYAELLLKQRAANVNPTFLHQLSTAIENAGKNTNSLKNWALLLTKLAGYTLRNTIAIGSYEKQIEDTAISI
jgi:HEAT repeat protein